MLDTSLQGYAGLGALKPEDAFEDAVSAAAEICIPAHPLQSSLSTIYRWGWDRGSAKRIQGRVQGRDTLLPFASVQLTGKEPVWNRSFEKSLSPRKNKDWAIITGVFHEGAAVAAIHLLNEGEERLPSSVRIV